ncbi:MAG: hypothetical protein AAB439_00325 [Patescibacteria group bacterium]
MAYDGGKVNRLPNSTGTNRNSYAEGLRALGIVGLFGAVAAALIGTGGLATTIHGLQEGISSRVEDNDFIISFDSHFMDIAGLGAVGTLVAGAFIYMLYSTHKYKV